MQSEEAISTFHSAVDKFRNLWRSIEIDSVSAHRGGTWYNVCTGLRLRTELPTEVEALNLVSLDDFSAQRAVAPIDELDSILVGLRRGTLSIGGREVHLGAPPDRPETQGIPAQNLPWTFYDLEPDAPRCWNGSIPETRRFQLETTGASFRKFWTNDEWRALEDRLMANNPPVVGMNDLAENLLGFRCAFQVWQASAQLALIAPLYSGFYDEIEVKPSSVVLRASGPSTAPIEDFRLATVVVGRASVDRRIQPLQLTSATAAGNKLEMECEVTAPEGLIIDALLLLRGSKVGRLQQVISTENPRLTAHSVFDRNIELLSSALFPPTPTRASGAFEVAVAWLLHLCGFQVVNYGLRDLKPSDEIDVLAFVPYGNQALAVEATLRSPRNKDKLSKLRGRVDDLSNQLHDFEIVGVVASASPTAYQAEANDAVELGIVPMYRDQLDAVYDLAVKNRSPRDIFAFVKGLLADRK
jgi:hypothetical protein